MSAAARDHAGAGTRRRGARDHARREVPPPKFAMVPTPEDLASQERVFSFVPSKFAEEGEAGGSGPRVLTRAQVADFNERGYLIGLPALEPAEIGDLRAYFDDLHAAVVASGGDGYSISSAHLNYGRVYDVLTDPRIVGIARDLLGTEHVVGWGTHFFAKLPGDGREVSMHQDAVFWPMSPSRTVTVWLAIDDADLDNACMRFVPRTHLLGALRDKDESAMGMGGASRSSGAPAATHADCDRDSAADGVGGGGDGGGAGGRPVEGDGASAHEAAGATASASSSSTAGTAAGAMPASVLGRGLDEADVRTLGEHVPVVLRAGQVSVHDSLLVHGSPANESGRRRCGLTLRYCDASVRCFLGWQGKGVVVSGEDKEGHWENPPRPERE